MTGSDFTGCMINSHVELKTWVREHMAALIQSGRLFDKKAYKECFKILKKARSVGLIIPLDEEAVMEPQVDSFMRVIQEQGHTKLINRTIFYGIQVLIGDSDDESRQEMLLLHLERIISKAARRSNVNKENMQRKTEGCSWSEHTRSDRYRLHQPRNSANFADRLPVRGVHVRRQ